MSGCDCHSGADEIGQRRVLLALLLINALMFFLEFAMGLIGQSTGLIADSLDMLADATVYGLALYAIGRGLAAKARAAHLSGLFQVALAIGVMLDVGRRFMHGSEPESTLMMGIGSMALAANISCLALLARHRKGEIHMRASWIFSRNDVLANLGVMISGALVAWLDSSLPDLLIGLAIAVMVLTGGISILRQARQTAAGSPEV
jgi:cation diffusion facilitator family transporter